MQTTAQTRQRTLISPLVRPRPPARTHEIEVEVASGACLRGTVAMPWREDCRGAVVLAGGLGSSRHGVRTRHAVRALGDAGMATLAIDLLTPLEAEYLAGVFDAELLAERLLAAGRWLGRHSPTSSLPLGFFATSGCARGALLAADRCHASVCAVIAHGERPDSGRRALGAARTPRLLVAGDAVAGERDVELARLAARWFAEHIAEGAPAYELC
jgi:putative phosphoribosyl transferase